MKIKLLTCMVGHPDSHNAGDVIDRSDAEATRLIDAGFAVPHIDQTIETPETPIAPVTPPAVAEPVETATLAPALEVADAPKPAAAEKRVASPKKK